jgi:uracil-DNA glycosylase
VSISADDGQPNDRLDRLRSEAASCRACPLWKNATQTVFGEGPSHAEIMFVGEQPGDREETARVARSSGQLAFYWIGRSRKRGSIAGAFM